MKIQKGKPFEVTIAHSVTLMITRVRVDDTAVYFEVWSKDTYHGNIYPALCETYGISWKSTGGIHAIFVKQLGEAIELHDA
jgi:hypothetical protein